MNRQTQSDGWRGLRTSIGTAEFVPDAINHLLHARSREQATSAYWELDNRVVIQGQLFDSALPTCRELMRSICERDYTSSGLLRSLDLLVELAYGEADESEVLRGNADLGTRCRATITEGLGCIEALIHEEDERVLLDVLDLVDLLEHDGASRSAFLSLIPRQEWSDDLRQRARQFRGAN